jgi:hypothetical protein
MTVQMDEAKRRIILSVWNNLSASFASSIDQNMQTVKGDIAQLAQYLAQADIVDGVVEFSQTHFDHFAYAYSYLGEGGKPEQVLSDAAFVIYDKFVDDFFEADG